MKLSLSIMYIFVYFVSIDIIGKCPHPLHVLSYIAYKQANEILSVVIFGSYNESRQISAKTLIYCGENTNGEIFSVLVFPQCRASCIHIINNHIFQNCSLSKRGSSLSPLRFLTLNDFRVNIFILKKVSRNNKLVGCTLLC